MRVLKLDEKAKKDILKNLLKRSPDQYDEYEQTVREILANVRENGDRAVMEYTNRFDCETLDVSGLRVTEEEIEEAAETFERVNPKLLDAMRRSMENIRQYHEKQLQNSWITMGDKGTILGQKITPIEKAGIYVPGGKAAYPSSTLMCVIPAQVAGVSRIVMTTPADADGKVTPSTLVAAKLTGVSEIYKVGGAQAVAALAYGTETIPKVDKIVGPGNIFVALAKKAVFGHVSIDSIAGPSEILILADDTANARYVAADLLSQAEHDQMASAILITTSERLAGAVNREIEDFLRVLKRRDIIQSSLNQYGYILLADSMEDAVAAANDIASEHVEILTAEPFEVMTKLKNAGAIFLGEYSSEPLGDYFAGPNHVLPTNGTAKFFSPLSVDAFIKKSSIISYSRDALLEAADDIIRFAEAEGLSAHANSIRVRKDAAAETRGKRMLVRQGSIKL
ncbi:MAG: histidinol dehydrogenase [Lachnospiraceae bacterium]|nr:histidinol dehydrogenase [Lachnospiraceae bacterium]